MVEELERDKGTERRRGSKSGDMPLCKETSKEICRSIRIREKKYAIVLGSRERNMGFSIISQ